MTTTTETRPTESSGPTSVLANAEVDLFNVTTAHRVAQEASDAARVALADIEAAADRGAKVDTATYTTAKADLSLKARRTAALGRVLQAAQDAVNAAQADRDAATLRELVAAVPGTEKARQKAIRAVQEYVTAMNAQSDAVAEVERAAKHLPPVSHIDPAGTGWAAIATTYSDGHVDLNHRLGYLLVDGAKVERPKIPAELDRLAQDIARLAQHKRG